jgi:hypothetical protein
MLKDLFSFDGMNQKDILEYRDKLRSSQKSFLQKKAQQENRGSAMKAKEEKKEATLKLYLNEAEMGHQAVVNLKKLFHAHPGKSPVHIQIGPTSLRIDESFGVKITEELLMTLKQMQYVESVSNEEAPL